ncbi:hypothetical protein JRQ81_017614, partial [Phrynocephalus forsythii]
MSKIFPIFRFIVSLSINMVLPCNVALAFSMNQLSAIARFHFLSCHQYVPARLQIFQAKIINHLFGGPVWAPAVNYKIDHIAASFLCKMLGVPNAIRRATLLSKPDCNFPTTLAWLCNIKFWL